MCRLLKLSVLGLAVLGAACGADVAAPDHNVPPAATVTVPATMLVPALAVSDSSIQFCYAPGSSRNCVFLKEDIRITSTGSALRWTASSDQPWIVLSRTQGTTPTTVRVSVGTLPPRTSQGAHGTITVRSGGAINSPLTIRVGLSFVAIRPGQ